MRAGRSAETAEVPVRAERALAAANAFENVRPAAREALTALRTAENIVDGKALAARPATRYLVFIRRAVLIVERTLLLVAEDLVRLVDLLELRLVAARVRVMRAGEFAERLLDVIRRGGAGHAERFVVVRR